MRGLKRFLLGAALCALASCGGHEPGAPAQKGALRDPGARISSAVLFDPARFAGTWHVAASGVPGCAGAVQEWRWHAEKSGTGYYTVSGTDCGGAKPSRLSGRMELTGPGARFTPEGGAYSGAPVWALWFDQDYRIAVLGTPSGKFGVVLSRQLPPRSDLMRAAREVLDFNGYDPGRIGR